MKKRNRAWFYDRYIKRFFDIFLSLSGLVLFSPAALLCALAIKLDDPCGSVFFVQERNGKGGKVFKVVKFRTMKRELSGGSVAALEDTLTKVGKVIRKFSLDEIPQMISILLGHMSLIGPRPLLLSYYEWYNKTELRRFEVRPGLTGLSQINGRANLNWDQRFLLDVQYVDNLSFLLDLKIFLRTIPAVFSHKDVMLENGKALESFDVYRRSQLEQERIPTPLKRTTKETSSVYRSKSMGA